MKQPRTSDFDPNAKEHALLKSSMEDFPTIEQPLQRDRQIQPADHVQASALPDRPRRPVRDVPEVPVTASGRRKIKSRHAFDVYEDQVEALQQLALQDRMRGGAGSMSAMVREAIDDYIAKVNV